MAQFEPFEPAPSIAVAVSGGADSMALAVLLSDWAEARGGQVIALTVDHGMRAGSGSEAREVGRRLSGLGIESHLLTWTGAKPRSNRQAEARAARYALLSAWCARRGLLHLGVGHHRDDQAETFLLRLARGSGLDGLAGMPAVREQAGMRLLRPLLPIAKCRLEATLRARKLEWIEDPSNANPAFDRTHVRLALAGASDAGLSADRLVAAATHLGRARAVIEGDVATLLAGHAAFDPAGFAWLEPAPLVEAVPEVGMRALARILMVVGGAHYTPRLDRLERLYTRLSQGLGRGATLSGCRLVPHRGRLLIVREAGRTGQVDLRPGERLRWDGRFQLAVARRADPRRGALRLGALGQTGWAGIAKLVVRRSAALIPAAARPALPAVWDQRGLLEVPHLGYRRDQGDDKVVTNCCFSPENTLTQARFAVAWVETSIISMLS